jgi:F-type H+-transporting ATPase subunit c
MQTEDERQVGRAFAPHSSFIIQHSAFLPTFAHEQPTPGHFQLKIGTPFIRGAAAIEAANRAAQSGPSAVEAREETLMIAPLMSLLAQTTALIGDRGLVGVGAGIGAGIVTLGAARGIGHLAGQAMEGIARQPEAGGRIGTNMIIAAALIEGFTFFALVICLQLAGKIPAPGTP